MKKHIMISEETHKRLRKYCVEHGFKLNMRADTLLSEEIK
jgi:hypothetical protein